MYFSHRRSYFPFVTVVLQYKGLLPLPVPKEGDPGVRLVGVSTAR